MRKIVRKIFKRSIQTIKKCNLTNDEGITNRISFGNSGIARYDVTYSDGESQTFVGKYKSKKIIKKGLGILSGKQPTLALRLAINHKVLGFNKSHLRETDFYKNLDASLKNYLIPMYGYYRNRLTDTHVLFLKYIDAPKKITAKDYKPAFDAITDFHKAYYEQPEKAERLGVNCYGSRDYKKCKRALLKMFQRLDSDNQNVLKPTQTLKVARFLQNIDCEFIPYHRTLTHNDFSPRNLFFDGGQLYIYDWELACYQNPEHDLIEFLVSVMHEVNDEQLREMILYFKQILFEKIGKQIDEQRYTQILRFNVLEYAGIRLTLLRLVNLQFGLPFIGQMTANMGRLMDFLRI